MINRSWSNSNKQRKMKRPCLYISARRSRGMEHNTRTRTAKKLCDSSFGHFFLLLSRGGMGWTWDFGPSLLRRAEGGGGGVWISEARSLLKKGVPWWKFRMEEGRGFAVAPCLLDDGCTVTFFCLFCTMTSQVHVVLFPSSLFMRGVCRYWKGLSRSSAFDHVWEELSSNNLSAVRSGIQLMLRSSPTLFLPLSASFKNQTNLKHKMWSRILSWSESSESLPRIHR